MNIRAALSHLNSGKKVKRKSWNDSGFIIKGIISIIDNGEYMFPKYYKCYDSNFESFYEWLADADDLIADDWIVVEEKCNCKKKCADCKCEQEKYYTTSEIAKELDCSVNFIFKFLTENGIAYYDKKKKLYVVGDAYAEYVNYKVNYDKYKKLHLMWNEKGREWIKHFIEVCQEHP